MWFETTLSLFLAGYGGFIVVTGWAIFQRGLLQGMPLPLLGVLLSILGILMVVMAGIIYFGERSIVRLRNF